MCTGKGLGRGDREVAICQSYLGGLVIGCGWEGGRGVEDGGQRPSLREEEPVERGGEAQSSGE